jgi:TonB family protein
MPHALLLSPDDQAVSAITGVLEEMSVTFERPLDGPSAAKKLNSQSFDLVLVDCENLPAAKLIFDVCRRSQLGTNPVPIAIVDGRAGLPTAFRLGAELILTKPVAKDQARTTIRTAVTRVRKDEPARTIQPFESTPAEVALPAIPEEHAHAAAAAANSSLARIVETAPPTAPAEPLMARMSSATDEVAPATGARKPQPAFFNDSILEPPKSAPPLKTTPALPSDDPVLADLESDSPTPVFTSYTQPKKKGSGSLVALLLLMLAGGGFYAAWMYQPGFREMAQPQIDRLLQAVGTPPAAHNAASPPTASTPVTAPAPQPAATSALPAPDAAADPAAASTPSPAPADAAAPALPQATPTTGAPEPSDAAKTPPESKRSVLVALPSDTELPGEKTAVILSSQGAEKRLIRHQPPVYPAEARKQHVEGTVVLKAVVSEGGKVEGVRLVEGDPTLATAANSAVKQWHYRPYIRDGKARPFQTIVLVDFQRP